MANQPAAPIADPVSSSPQSGSGTSQNGTHAPASPPTVEQPPAPAPVTPPPQPPQVVRVVDTEAIERARSEEKQKLYKEQEALRGRVKDLESQLQGRLTPDEKLQAQLEGMRAELRETTSSLETARRAHEAQVEEYQRSVRQAQLQSYLDRRLREEQAAGHQLMYELVGGRSEQEIDASIEAARKEYARLQSHFYAQFQAQHQPAPSPQPQVVAVSAVPPPSPAAFPMAPNPQTPPMVNPGSPAFTEHVQAVTSPEAVRNGTYAQHRQRLLATVRQGPPPPMNGQPFANMPRTPQPAAVQQYGQVQVPQGYPTGPVANPHMQTSPPQQQYLPPIPVHQMEQSGLMPTAAQQYGQQLLEGPPVQGLVAPPQPPPGLFDPAAARQAAVEAAQRTLAHPSATQVPTQGPAPRLPGEYAVANPNAQGQQAVFPSGVHPMARDT